MMSLLRYSLVIIYLLILGCANNTTITNNGKPLPKRQGTSSQFFKSDFDRMADIELDENMISLKTLMLKLYKRNPNQLVKSTSEGPEKMVQWVFDGESEHAWQFEAIQNKQGIEAIHLAFSDDFDGDRVLPFIVGISTMYRTAHGGKRHFFLTDNINPQSLYNVARNLEIAVWKLSSSRNQNGEPYLITNEISATDHNLSFEREFGKIIGRTDLYAFMLAEKQERQISKIAQSIATMAFLPF